MAKSDPYHFLSVLLVVESFRLVAATRDTIGFAEWPTRLSVLQPPTFHRLNVIPFHSIRHTRLWK